MARPISWAWRSYAVTNPDQRTFTVVVKGRDRWALEQLAAAGPRGCTPIDNPAPRWSGYIFNLRELGISIETQTEPHGGPFQGRHGRYVLLSTVEPIEGLEGAA